MDEPGVYEFGKLHPGRRSIRLPGYDYSMAGAYFVTIVASGRRCIFGSIDAASVALSPSGKIVEECWLAIPQHFAGVELVAHVVMPNHHHGLLSLPATDNSWEGYGPRGTRPGSVSAIIQSFKSSATRRIRLALGSYPTPIWQSGFYEHVIRNEPDLHYHWQYILDNPLKWELDRENPDRDCG